jgi:hypothetical protein
MTTARHLVFLVEEPSAEAFLLALLPRVLPEGRTFEVHPFQGKPDLLKNLQARLRGYARWLPRDWRILVLVDRDGDDCLALKERLEASAGGATLRSRSRADAGVWQLANRIAVEELEAWYFGDWAAVRQAYPRAPATLDRKRGFRDPDGILGGTWEAFERVLRRSGYFETGLRKVEAARAVGACIDPGRSCSRSFARFHEAVTEAVA